MQLKAKSLCHFFPVVNQCSLLPLDRSSPLLSSFLQPSQKQQKIVLQDNLLLLAQKEEEGFRYTHALPLTQGLKFQRIYGHRPAPGQPRPLSGFRIINSEKECTDVLLPFPHLAAIWVRELGKALNQVGFQQVYQMVRKIGKGSTASVYEVKRIEDSQLFAAKVVLKSFLAQKEERTNSLNHEISLLRAMDHPNIIKLHGVFESDQAVYLIFQRLGGGNLVERINRQRGFSGAQVKEIMRGVIEGLAYLHKFDIAHRDIKLQNIIFKDEASLHAVIADFGLAVFTEEEPYAYYRCGTPGYVAPEIIRMRENKKVKVACDIFSAGVIFHVLLTNSYLFPGQTNDEIYKSNLEAKIDFSAEKYRAVDSQAMELMGRMLSVKAGDRITAQEILQEEYLGEAEKEEVSPAVTEVGEYTI